MILTEYLRRKGCLRPWYLNTWPSELAKCFKCFLLPSLVSLWLRPLIFQPKNLNISSLSPTAHSLDHNLTLLSFIVMFLLSLLSLLLLTIYSLFIFIVAKQPCLYPFYVHLPYHGKALNSLICADVPLRNCSFIHPQQHVSCKFCKIFTSGL